MENTLLADALYYALLAAPFIAIYWVAIDLWNYTSEYYWQKWFLGNDYITLEIKLPKEQKKTPAAMEAVLNALWEPGDNNGWKGDWLALNTLPIISFEVASIGGSIHFFFWVPRKFKPRVEAHIYAQFSQAEIIEVPDYTRLINFDSERDKIMGFDYSLNFPDPVPIKTYKMLKLDAPGIKEDEKVDPITQTLEVMASIGPHENMWWQIVARAHKTRYVKKLRFTERLKKAVENFNPFQLFYNEKVNWQEKVDELIEEIKQKYTPKDKETMLPMGGMATPQDTEYMKMITENASKAAYEVGMRTIYFAPKEHFNGAQTSNMGSMFKAYGASKPYNNFKPAFVAAANDKWWEPGHEHAVKELKELMFPDYAGRRFFNMKGSVGHGFASKQYPTFVMSTEELATLYHFPGSVAQTPSFERIPSATSQAPANLPTEGGAPSNLPV